MKNVFPRSVSFIIIINVMGGGLAIGHPLGATGVRLVGALARILQAKEGCYGLADACVGGGQEWR